MLENPRSIKVLSFITDYYQEIKRYIEDSDQWLNNSNE